MLKIAHDHNCILMHGFKFKGPKDKQKLQEENAVHNMLDRHDGTRKASERASAEAEQEPTPEQTWRGASIGADMKKAGEQEGGRAGQASSSAMEKMTATP